MNLYRCPMCIYISGAVYRYIQAMKYEPIQVSYVHIYIPGVLYVYVYMYVRIRICMYVSYIDIYRL